MKIFTMVILGIFLSSTVAFAAECTKRFSWLPNSEGDIAGYKIHYGLTDNGPYPYMVDVANSAPVDGRIWGEVSDLVCDAHYYFVCTAYNDAGLESGFSAQVDYVLTAPVSGEDVTKVFGSAAGADYVGTIQDTFIDINTLTFSTRQHLATYTWQENMVANAIIMKIDLSQFPDNVQIQSASLQLYAYEAGGDSTYDISVHKIINKNPNLSVSTGFTYDGTNSWTANTSCYNNIPMAQADISAAEGVNSVDMSVGYKSWDVTGMLRDWLAAPGTNYGLLLNSDNVAAANSYRNFASSEAADTNQRPKLVVTYKVDVSGLSSPAGFQLLN